jgi:hypothetical protein
VLPSDANLTALDPVVNDCFGGVSGFQVAVMRFQVGVMLICSVKPPHVDRSLLRSLVAGNDSQA